MKIVLIEVSIYNFYYCEFLYFLIKNFMELT